MKAKDKQYLKYWGAFFLLTIITVTFTYFVSYEMDLPLFPNRLALIMLYIMGISMGIYFAYKMYKVKK